jgi:hypothetical protein
VAGNFPPLISLKLPVVKARVPNQKRPRQNWVVYIREGLFKLPTGHLNLVSKSALYAKH